MRLSVPLGLITEIRAAVIKDVRIRIALTCCNGYQILICCYGYHILLQCCQQFILFILQRDLNKHPLNIGEGPPTRCTILTKVVLPSKNTRAKYIDFLPSNYFIRPSLS